MHRTGQAEPPANPGERQRPRYLHQSQWVAPRFGDDPIAETRLHRRGQDRVEHGAGIRLAQVRHPQLRSPANSAVGTRAANTRPTDSAANRRAANASMGKGGDIASLSSSGMSARQRAEITKEEKAAIEAGLQDVFFGL